MPVHGQTLHLPRCHVHTNFNQTAFQREGLFRTWPRYRCWNCTLFSANPFRYKLGCVYFSHIIFPTFKIKVITNTRTHSYLPCPYLLPNGRRFCTYSSHLVPILLTSVYSHQGLAGIRVRPSMNQVRGRNTHPGRVTSRSIQSTHRHSIFIQVPESSVCLMCLCWTVGGDWRTCGEYTDPTQPKRPEGLLTQHHVTKQPKVQHPN